MYLATDAEFNRWTGIPGISQGIYLIQAYQAIIYTLSLHDALPIFGPAGHPQLLGAVQRRNLHVGATDRLGDRDRHLDLEDRKSTRLNSSHPSISYAAFCLKKKKSCSSISGY